MFDDASDDSSDSDKDQEHKKYHRICDQSPPPNLDKCEFMQWKINQLEQCIAARGAWDAKWSGDHSHQIAQKEKELRKWKKRLANAWDCKPENCE